jgi:hypothetical protein
MAEVEDVMEETHHHDRTEDAPASLSDVKGRGDGPAGG